MMQVATGAQAVDQLVSANYDVCVGHICQKFFSSLSLAFLFATVCHSMQESKHVLVAAIQYVQLTENQYEVVMRWRLIPPIPAHPYADCGWVLGAYQVNMWLASL